MLLVSIISGITMPTPEQQQRMMAAATELVAAAEEAYRRPVHVSISDGNTHFGTYHDVKERPVTVTAVAGLDSSHQHDADLLAGRYDRFSDLGSKSRDLAVLFGGHGSSNPVRAYKILNEAGVIEEPDYLKGMKSSPRSRLFDKIPAGQLSKAHTVLDAAGIAHFHHETEVRLLGVFEIERSAELGIYGAGTLEMELKIADIVFDKVK